MGEHSREWGISPQKGTWKTGILVANTGDTRKKMRSQGEQLGKQLPKAGDFTYFYHEEFSRMSPWSLLRTSSHFIKNRPGAELTHGYVAGQTCRIHPEHSKKNRIWSQIDGFSTHKDHGFFDQTLPFSFHFMVLGYIEVAHGVNINPHPTSAIDLPWTMLLS